MATIKMLRACVRAFVRDVTDHRLSSVIGFAK